MHQPIEPQDNMVLLYDNACRAIAEARSVFDVKPIRDAARVMEAAARAAKNRDMEADAAEIRFKATRRIGELMREQANTVGMARPGPKPEIGSAADPNR